MFNVKLKKKKIRMRLKHLRIRYKLNINFTEIPFAIKFDRIAYCFFFYVSSQTLESNNYCNVLFFCLFGDMFFHRTIIIFIFSYHILKPTITDNCNAVNKLEMFILYTAFVSAFEIVSFLCDQKFNNRYNGDYTD